MSCIDSAIIRALVEHIGMNPDEIPTTGGGSGTYTGEVLDIPAEYNPFRIKKEDMPQYGGLDVGSVVSLKFDNNMQFTFLLTSVIYKSGSPSTIVAYHLMCDQIQAELRLQESGTHSGYFVFACLGGFSLDNFVQEGHQLINFTPVTTDTRPLPAYYTLLLMSSLRTIISEVHKAMNNSA